MPNAVDPAFLDHPLPARHAAREKTDSFCFAAVALLTPKKGMDVLLRAFASAFRADPRVRLDIGGDGSEREALQAMVRELGLSDQVRFLGVLDRAQVLELIATADALVLPSRYETFGIVLIEALALGKPVIATRCGGPESIVREQDGLLVPTDDVAALAQALRRLHLTAWRYDPHALRAGCRARYGEPAVVSRLLDAYQRLPERTGAGPPLQAHR
jgi:glycosyltransferase involved in cell wall biosynthesis